MIRYEYKARDKEGKLHKGYRETLNRDALISEMKGSGWYPIYVKESKDINFSDLLIPKRIPLKDLAIFCRQFSTILNAGVPLMDTLDILKRQSVHNSLKIAINKVYGNLNRGRTLAESLRENREVFPEIMINLIEAGEISGSLDIILERLATHFEKEYDINQKVRSAMTYPTVILFVAIGVLTFMITFVLPTFVTLFEGVGGGLPIPTLILLKFAEFIKENGLYLLLILLVMFFALGKYVKTPTGRHTLDKIKLGIPIFGQISKKVAISRFSRTLATMNSAGVPLIEALEVVKKAVANTVIASGLEFAKSHVIKGRGLSKPLEESGQFPPLVIQMIGVGEETGALDIMLEKVADYYENEVKYSVDRLSTLIEPLMIVGLGIIVGVIVAVMVLPMFEMIQFVG
jgi:type IV pilus assembly protein PilC